MYVGQIYLDRGNSFKVEDASDAINTLLGALRMNGQVCGKEFPIAVTLDGYVATVLLPEKSALEVTRHNRYVREALQRLREAGLGEPECTVIEDLANIGVCSCAYSQSYILYTNYLALEPPLRCGDCFLPVPLYRIPPWRNEEYHDVIYWQSDYQACDSLQMNSTTLERAAMRQLSQLNSSLSQTGLTICGCLFKATQIPIYYYLYRYGTHSISRERRRCCPSCSGEWLLAEPWHLFDFKCDRCHLLSNISWNVRQ